MQALLNSAFDAFQSQSAEAETKIIGAVLMLYNEHSIQTIRLGDTPTLQEVWFELGYTYEE